MSKLQSPSSEQKFADIPIRPGSAMTNFVTNSFWGNKSSQTSLVLAPFLRSIPGLGGYVLSKGLTHRGSGYKRTALVQDKKLWPYA